MRVVRISLALATLLAPAHAHAGYRIEQQATAVFDKQEANTTHLWLLDEGRFQLRVQSPRGDVTYLFNGKSFYICGKLGDAGQSYLAKNQIDGKAVAAKYASGICQSVPSNFLARFFLAQSMAAESLDRSDGLKVSLSLNQYQVRNTGQTKKVQALSCTQFQRSYHLEKALGETSKHTVEVDEELCLATTPQWRADLWTEVSKTLLRQPGGAPLMLQMRKDHQNLQGFPLSSKSRYQVTPPAGEKHRGQVVITLKSLKEMTLAENDFALPKGYQMFDPETSKLLAGGTDAHGGKAPKNQQEGEPSQLRIISGAFLCALSGSLGCLLQ